MKMADYLLALGITVMLMLLIVATGNEITALRKQIVTLQQQNTKLQEQTAKLAEKLDKLEKQKPAEKQSRGTVSRGTKQIMEVTAYWEGSCGKDKGDKTYGITASGERVRDGICAASKDIAMGTRIYIPAMDKMYIVKDRGGAITKGKLDLYMDGADKCYDFGRQELEVYVLGKAEGLEEFD
jgi:3D (Asp-Asp-Asp) domain-containing protein